jgi:2-C-methyl-D-erythritol 4-phosphate cytidylyltransferase
MARFAVILPAAGKSTRMSGFQRKKPFVELKGRPVWVRTAEHFQGRADVCQTILVVSPEDMEWFRDTFKPNLAFMDIKVVAGGPSRAESVRNGISAVTEPAEYIAVHDAARPLLTPQWIDQVFAAAQLHKAVIPGVRISSTVKKINDQGKIEATVDRTNLVQAQTPQVFERGLLEKAFATCRNLSAVTDEASLVEQMNHPVHVIDGWDMNIKITTNDDFRMAELYVNALPKSGGIAALHPFADEMFQ